MALDFQPFHGNFIQLAECLAHLNLTAVDGILLDLGLSLHHLASSGRGFSFKRDEPLDMRMDIRSNVKADDLVNTMGEDQLFEIFKTYGEERWARPIARQIVKRRQKQPLQTSRQLAQLVAATIPKRFSAKAKIHPATRVFMALRIAVNKELDRLDAFMQQVTDWLLPNGRLCILSFHSLEDRLVKRHLQLMARDCLCPPDFPQCVCDKIAEVRILTKKALRPQRRRDRRQSHGPQHPSAGSGKNLVGGRRSTQRDTTCLKATPDQHEQRNTGVWIILMSFFIAELLFYTWCRVQNVRIGYEITQASAQYKKLVTMQNNLKIETAHLKSPERISKIAREQLGLTMPSPRQVIILP